jgi:hypothetical protein
MIRYSTEPGSPVVEITVHGHVSNDELKASIERLREDLETQGKTRVLEIIEQFTGMEPSALWTDITLAMPLAQKVSRAAVVADQGWVRGVSRLGRLFTRAEFKVFGADELAAARAWIREP